MPGSAALFRAGLFHTPVVRIGGMDENPFNPPPVPPSQDNGHRALGAAWVSFGVLSVALMGVPMLLIPDEIETPAQKASLELANNLWASGCVLSAALVMPLSIWTWWRWKRACSTP